ncbi:MAG: helix-turn-helix transcriptional regulator [Herpetosiphonaceae bacterium]|nr:helix-turn-helix transcriptional regulator [Herpetosiphonaceae bacterium]
MTGTIDIQERILGTRCCGDEPLTDLTATTAQELSDDFLIFGHPIRLQILHMLGRNAGQVCVCDLEAALPVKQPTVSHHLRLLREAGLIDCERQGLWAYYFINRTAVAQRWAAISAYLQPLV